MLLLGLWHHAGCLHHQHHSHHSWSGSHLLPANQGFSEEQNAIVLNSRQLSQPFFPLFHVIVACSHTDLCTSRGPYDLLIDLHMQELGSFFLSIVITEFFKPPPIATTAVCCLFINTLPISNHLLSPILQTIDNWRWGRPRNCADSVHCTKLLASKSILFFFRRASSSKLATSLMPGEAWE